jgi:hypothetical protein
MMRKDVLNENVYSQDIWLHPGPLILNSVPAEHTVTTPSNYLVALFT